MFELVKSATFDAWFSSLRDVRAKARIAERLDRVADGNSGDVTPVGGGVSELRIDHGPVIACAEEAPNDPVCTLKTLGTAARAHNMSQLAEAAAMTRAGLYKSLSGEGNPNLAITMKAAKATYRLALVPDRE